MSLPSIEKTWQFDLNRTVATDSGALAVAKPIMLAIKDRLKAFSMLPATVAGSSDSSAAGMDAVDRWAAAANIVCVAAAGSAHSWIVLNLVGMGTAQICIDMIGSTTSTFGDVWFSPSAGFTGGSTTNRPTATDEREITFRTQWCQASTSTNVRLHLWQSSDGACRRVAVMYNNFLVSLWLLDTIKSPRGGTAGNYVCGVIGSSGVAANTGTFAEMCGAYELTVRNSTTVGQAALTCEGLYTVGSLGSVQTVADDIDGSWPILPLGIYSNTAGARGRYGQVYDLWMGSSANAAGQEFDDAGGKVLGQLGHLLFPSNGVTLAAA